MVAVNRVDLGKLADTDDKHMDRGLSLDPAFKVFKETVLVAKSGKRIDMSLGAVIADGSDKVVRLARKIPYDNASAGAYIIFTINFFGPVLPYIACPVHVFGRKVICIDCILRPL